MLTDIVLLIAMRDCNSKRDNKSEHANKCVIYVPLIINKLFKKVIFETMSKTKQVQVIKQTINYLQNYLRLK